MSEDKQFDIVSYIKQNRCTFLFLLTMIVLVSIVAIYQYWHPLVCSDSAKVKEIISITKDYAKIKLDNEQIIDFPINKKKVIERFVPVADMIVIESETITEYHADVKVGTEICLQYSRM